MIGEDLTLPFEMRPLLKDFMSKNRQRIMIFADECTKKIISSMDTSS